VVLYYDDGLTLFDEFVKQVYQLFTVAQVESDCGLFEDIEIGSLNSSTSLGVALQAFGKFGDELHALGFAAG